MKEPILNDDLPSRILYGAVKVKSRVTQLTETSALFEDGTVEEDIDVIVFATGYTFSFPFLEESLVKIEHNMVSLYKYMFPPQLEKPTLTCMGLIQPLGSIFPTVELQARWATRVFKGECMAQHHQSLQSYKMIARFVSVYPCSTSPYLESYDFPTSRVPLCSTETQ